MGEKITEKAGEMIGKAHAAAATLKGDTGIFRKLQEEHAEVSTLMKRVATSSDPETRRDLFPKIRRELLAHAEAEEKEFYPILEQRPETQALAKQARNEHAEVELMLDQLVGMDASSDAWVDVFDRLMKSVEQHVQEEEHEIFPKAKPFFDDTQANQVEKVYMERKREAMQHFA